MNIFRKNYTKNNRQKYLEIIVQTLMYPRIKIRVVFNRVRDLLDAIDRQLDRWIDGRNGLQVLNRK